MIYINILLLVPSGYVCEATIGFHLVSLKVAKFSQAMTPRYCPCLKYTLLCPNLLKHFCKFFYRIYFVHFIQNN